jgi:hypothetical protein
MIFGLMRENKNLLEVSLESGMIMNYELPEDLTNPNIASIQFLGM